MLIENQQQKLDIHYMQRALRLAKRGEGMVSPNPLVGAVLVKNNHIIGEGYHQRYGEAHAEINAIESSHQSLKGTTLYSTLEPCCHKDKQTPPCVNRIIKKGIKRVVVASKDPNPEVNGEGISLLREAGIDVIDGILGEENVQLNKFYYTYTATKLPYITLKLAQSLDGYISGEKNQLLWLTGERSRRLVHRWRSIYDAVLIGANTLRVDNPQLTVRYGKKRNPLRIILTGSTHLKSELQIFNQKPENKTWILSTEKNQSLLSKKLDHTGCQLIGLPARNDDHLEISTVLEFLGKQKITSIIVEGGQQIFSQFITSGLWNELNILIAPKLLGRGVKSIDIQTNYIISPYHLHRTKKLGEDMWLTYLPS
jgi:diaminohydroxyphosphoribosylaminopyrimidine deaminase/5-amino-6-(5-phosphoribosylamino)uracil reductase